MDSRFSILNACMDYRYIEDPIVIDRVLYYPNKPISVKSKRVEEAERIGIKYLCNFGPQRIYGNKYKAINILGKGHSSIVSLVFVKGLGIKVAKIRRIDSKRKTLSNEARMLMQSSKVGVSPKVYYYSEDFIIMDYVGTISLGYIIRNLKENERKRFLLSAINSARLLDSIGILHSELNRPWSNVFFPSYPSEFPSMIIDLESSSLGCGNVNKIVGGILSKFRVNKRKRNLYKLLKEYKKTGCEVNIFSYIIDELNLLFKDTL
ncbi:MAG: hypothetical protein G5Z42_04775 [Caldisphaeraceae archaeon]|nr:hypothetical protein [Caldisphaeraceae archaeon]MEB3691850.1 hypothetical protein [Caldisphaeraceae archaeon]MEB3798116.1 hypothetical protein [Caldisphaeraceae archaeon]